MADVLGTKFLTLPKLRGRSSADTAASFIQAGSLLCTLTATCRKEGHARRCNWKTAWLLMLPAIWALTVLSLAHFAQACMTVYLVTARACYSPQRMNNTPEGRLTI
eukprot:1164972-Amphidinium_carterae.1